METLPFWKDAPCNSIRASEGSMFPPRDRTGEDTVFVYDKDVCRTLPFSYTKPVTQNGKWEVARQGGGRRSVAMIALVRCGAVHGNATSQVLVLLLLAFD